jgi:hypothetical protein
MSEIDDIEAAAEREIEIYEGEISRQRDEFRAQLSDLEAERDEARAKVAELDGRVAELEFEVGGLRLWRECVLATLRAAGIIDADAAPDCAVADRLLWNELGRLGTVISSLKAKVAKLERQNATAKKLGEVGR